jgi:hypothetical protein
LRDASGSVTNRKNSLFIGVYRCDQLTRRTANRHGKGTNRSRPRKRLSTKSMEPSIIRADLSRERSSISGRRTSFTHRFFAFTDEVWPISAQRWLEIALGFPRSGQIRQRHPHRFFQYAHDNGPRKDLLRHAFQFFRICAVILSPGLRTRTQPLNIPTELLSINGLVRSFIVPILMMLIGDRISIGWHEILVSPSPIC